METQIRRNLKWLLGFQVLFGAVFALVGGWLGGFQLGASMALGAGLMLLNLSMLAWSTWRMFTKKSIAWTSSLIVIKYAVLLGTLFYFSRTGWFDLFGIGLGIASFLIAVLALAVIQPKEKQIGTDAL
jgi:peptidoglycan/LPS O-acetylase OafA/YrhL